MVLKLAVIDDHPVYREGLRAIIARQKGLRLVAEAPNARQGYAAVDAAKPDLVLVDLALPGPDGISASRELIRRHPGRRVLVLSPRVEEHSIAEALGAGALGYLGKEQPVEELLHAIVTVAAGNTYLPPRISPERIRTWMRRGKGGPLGVLSQRERDVFELLVRGFLNECIAGELDISTRTVETHRSRIFRKLQVHSVAELVRFAARHGLLGA